MKFTKKLLLANKESIICGWELIKKKSQHSLKKKGLVLVLLAICSGCTTFRPPEVRPVEVVTIEKPAPMYHPPLPPKIKSVPVEWKILTPDTMEEYLNDLRAGEADKIAKAEEAARAKAARA